MWVGTSNDKALVLKTAAAHHAISALFPKPLSFVDKPLVIQYEVKFQNTHDCGGAYMKLLTHDKNFKPVDLNDKTPYTISILI